MLLPLHDVHRPRAPSPITAALLGLNAAAFATQLGIGLHLSVWQGGVVSWEITHGSSLEVSGRLHPCLTLIVCIALHGGLLHLAGTMLYLWAFGPEVENRLGRGRFLALYIASGLAGTLAHILTNWDSLHPAVGSSGAVTGIVGAYLVLCPKGRIRSLLVLIVFFAMVDVPAVTFIPVWVALHLAATQVAKEPAMTAWAHLGGFIVGCALAENWRMSP